MPLPGSYGAAQFDSLPVIPLNQQGPPASSLVFLGKLVAFCVDLLWLRQEPVVQQREIRDLGRPGVRSEATDDSVAKLILQPSSCGQRVVDRRASCLSGCDWFKLRSHHGFKGMSSSRTKSYYARVTCSKFTCKYMHFRFILSDHFFRIIKQNQIKHTVEESSKTCLNAKNHLQKD